MCKFHTIIAGNGDKSILRFTIDFEPIELHLSHEIMQLPQAYKKEWWQEVINFCCKVINKEERKVIVFDSRKTAFPERQELLAGMQRIHRTKKKRMISIQMTGFLRPEWAERT